MIEQGSPEWLAMRLGKLTASRMADVPATTKSGPSASRKNYLAQLVAERLTGLVQESFTNGAMQWGREHEPLARVEYEMLKNVSVSQVDFVNHPIIAMCGASPDGLVLDNGLVEIKCPNTATHIDYLLGKHAPVKYEPQMTLQLLCTEREWCDFVSYDPRMPEEHQLFVARFIPSSEYRKTVEKEAIKFLQEVGEVIEKLKDLVPKD
jgi:putative phage-type endonuclease